MFKRHSNLIQEIILVETAPLVRFKTIFFPDDASAKSGWMLLKDVKTNFKLEYAFCLLHLPNNATLYISGCASCKSEDTNSL